MSASEIKETKSNLKAWIDQLSDTNMLSMLDGSRTVNSGKFSLDHLSEFQKQNISEGLEDIKRGRIMTSDEFWNQLKKG